MLNRSEKSQDTNLTLVVAALLICSKIFIACKQDPPPKTLNKLPPPLAYASADFADRYQGYTVLVDSFDLANKAEAYYLAGQLRAAQTRSFVVLRANKKLFVCVGNNKTKRQAENISKYLNSRYELQSAVIQQDAKP